MKQMLSVSAVLLTAITAIFAMPVYAADLTFTCDSDECSLSSEDSLFDVKSFLPGDSVKKEIAVKNERNEECEVFLHIDKDSVTPDEFDDRLLTAVRSQDDDVYGESDGDTARDNKSIANIFGEDSISLGTVDSDTEKVFQWLVTFDTNAGNEFQGAKLSFNADVSATCVEPEVLGASTVSNISLTGTGGTGQVAGASTVGTVLAATGAWRERVLYTGVALGVLMMGIAFYVWTSEKKTSRAFPRTIWNFPDSR